jgi:hypothetical protein
LRRKYQRSRQADAAASHLPERGHSAISHHEFHIRIDVFEEHLVASAQIIQFELFHPVFARIGASGILHYGRSALRIRGNIEEAKCFGDSELTLL